MPYPTWSVALYLWEVVVGWSCRKEAGDTLDRATEYCRASEGSSNTWKVDGREFFYEVSSREYEDGRITGTVWEILNGLCYRRGGFRIEGNGKVARFPYLSKSILEG